MKIFILLVVVATLSGIEGKTFTRCGLVHELRRQGFPESKLRDSSYELVHMIVCLVMGECEPVAPNNATTFQVNTDDSGGHLNWVCLVEHESSRKTNAVGRPNTDGSVDYGLFQINDRYWCSNTSTPGKACYVTCAELLTDNITKTSKCAKKIYSQQGFNAWYGWKNHCQSGLPDISSC